MTENYDMPILFMVFNRPDCTRETFDAICKIKPARLYIAADGPRAHKTGEKELCEQTRDIVTKIDWACSVKTLFRENNLGCKDAVSGAITWFFENEEMGIILEDDCLPGDSFFAFCRELLLKYKDDERIWHIDGSSFQKLEMKASYDFSKYCLIWGWATWRRAWLNYSVNLKNFDIFKKTGAINYIWDKPRVAKYWLDNFELIDKSLIDTWDFQWMYAVWTNNGLSIRPSINLIKNIGFNQNATHTINPSKLFDEMKVEQLDFPLRHPAFILPNRQLDDECSEVRFEIYGVFKGLSAKLIKKIKSAFRI